MYPVVISEWTTSVDFIFTCSEFVKILFRCRGEIPFAISYLELVTEACMWDEKHILTPVKLNNDNGKLVQLSFWELNLN